MLRVALLILLATLPLARAQEVDFMENRWVVVLTADETFADAKSEATKLARESRLPFSMEGRVFDKKKGLIYPANYEDDVFAGNYVARRYNEATIKGKETEFFSVERSDGYEGFKPGYYITVAGIFDSAKAAQAQVKRLSASAPTAYAKKTRIYMGCMH